MGTYVGHEGPVLCCMWSPLKPQLIMTGSSDFMLHIWNYTLPAQSPKQVPNKTKENVKKKSKQKKSTKNKTDDRETSSETPSQSAEENKNTTPRK